MSSERHEQANLQQPGLPVASSAPLPAASDIFCSQTPSVPTEGKEGKGEKQGNGSALFISKGGREAAATARRGTICRESATSQIYCQLIKLTFVISQGREEGGKKSSSLLLNYLCPGSLHAMLWAGSSDMSCKSLCRGTAWATAGPPDL